MENRVLWVTDFNPPPCWTARIGIHVFLQAQLDGSGDRSGIMIAHATSNDSGKTFSERALVNSLPM